jgi:hypothetical protein
VSLLAARIQIRRRKRYVIVDSNWVYRLPKEIGRVKNKWKNRDNLEK